MGRDSCIGTKLAQILDSDAIHKVSHNSRVTEQDYILKEFTNVFKDMGDLAGEYTIHTNTNISLVAHPPRKLPFTLRDTVKGKLDTMVEKKVIAPVIAKYR